MDYSQAVSQSVWNSINLNDTGLKTRLLSNFKTKKEHYFMAKKTICVNRVKSIKGRIKKVKTELSSTEYGNENNFLLFLVEVWVGMRSG